MYKEFPYVNNDCGASTVSFSVIVLIYSMAESLDECDQDKKTSMTCVSQLPPNTVIVTTDQNIVAALLKSSKSVLAHGLQWAALVPALLFLAWM